MKKITDIHCHCLYGIDDGPKDLQESVALIKTEYEQGVRRIIVSPHFYSNSVHKNAELVEKRIKELESELKFDCPKLEIYSGNELYYSDELPELLKSGKALALADSEYVLIEFSTGIGFIEMRDALYNIQCQGYYPILAHMERYSCLTDNIEYVRLLYSMGIYLQVNASAVIGKEGYRIKRFLNKLFKADLIHFVATDAHDLIKRSPCMKECKKYLIKKYGEKLADKCIINNPDKIINKEII